MVNKAYSWGGRTNVKIRKRLTYDHLRKPWYNAVGSGLYHSLLPVYLLLRGGLQKNHGARIEFKPHGLGIII